MDLTPPSLTGDFDGGSPATSSSGIVDNGCGLTTPTSSGIGTPSLMLQHDGRGLLVVLVHLVSRLMDGDNLGDFLNAGDHLGLGLVILVNHGLVDLDNVEVVLVEIVLMDLVHVEGLLMVGIHVKVVLVEVITEDDLLVGIVLMDLVFVVVKLLNLLLVSV
jgi:hypothetical protein